MFTAPILLNRPFQIGRAALEGCLESGSSCALRELISSVVSGASIEILIPVEYSDAGRSGIARDTGLPQLQDEGRPRQEWDRPQVRTVQARVSHQGRHPRHADR